MPLETKETEPLSPETAEESNPLLNELTDGLLEEEVSEEEEQPEQDERVDDEQETEDSVSRQEFDQFQENLNDKFDSLMAALQQKNNTPQSQPQPAAPASQVDLDEMSNLQLATHINQGIYTQITPHLQNMQKSFQSQIDGMGARVWNIIETIAPPNEVAFIKDALAMIQRSPDILFSDALDAVRGKRIKKDNRNMSKKIRSDSNRRGKLSRRASRNPIPTSKPASEEKQYDSSKGISMIRDIVDEGRQKFGIAQ